ncbi:homeodomain-like superfamily protein [Tanacetum coccineum]
MSRGLSPAKSFFLMPFINENVFSVIDVGLLSLVQSYMDGRCFNWSKKQSTALVPKPIASLYLRFFPIFIPTLYPYKPPDLSVANRVLFTNAEDGRSQEIIREISTPSSGSKGPCLSHPSKTRRSAKQVRNFSLCRCLPWGTELECHASSCCS